MDTSGKMSIELIDHMGDDLRVANVARVSFDKWKEEFDKRDAKLIEYLAQHEHTSPFRHVVLSLRCSAPVFIARQLGKHQIGMSWNEVSRRYVDVNFDFYEPEGWRSRPTDGIKQGSSDELVTSMPRSSGRPSTPEEEYATFLYMAKRTYDRFIEAGVAPEQARMLLPQSMMVDWVWTGSIQAFYHVWRLRSGEGAQKEAKDFAQALDEIIEPLFPVCWQALKNAA